RGFLYHIRNPSRGNFVFPVCVVSARSPVSVRIGAASFPGGAPGVFAEGAPSGTTSFSFPVLPGPGGGRSALPGAGISIPVSAPCRASAVSSGTIPVSAPCRASAVSSGTIPVSALSRASAVPSA
ncbi:MAG: hypothetical protein J6A21_07825, partial [Lentisphaeria bacterium]|nr:hypothetical protein [Lentisphaeria bacterium]